MKQFFKDHWKVLFFIIFTINLFLVFYDFLPTLSEINGWDEAKYINQGRLLMEGTLPTFADNPFLSFFYGIVYLFFSNSPYWLIQTCSAGRFLMFGFNWLASFLIARELKEYSHPLVMIGIFLIYPLTTLLLNNPSDGLFAVLSGFTFWQMLRFVNTSRPKHLLFASIIVGLSALTRNDGVILWIIVLFLVVCLTGFRKQLIFNLLFTFLPCAVLLGFYTLLFGSITGDFSTHIQERSYTAFEQGHEIVFSGSGPNSPTINAMLDSRSTYGSPQENHYSPVLAILHNPPAYFARLKVILAGLPEKILDVYNKKIAIPLFLLALRGIWELIRKKKWNFLLLLVAWPAYLLTYFLTFFRGGYLRTPFFIVFGLAAIGLTSLIKNLNHPSERGVWSAVMLAFVVYGIVDNKLAIFYGAGLFLTAMWVVIFLSSKFPDFKHFPAASLLIFLCFGCILRGNFASPRFYLPGNSPDEKASVFMRENLPAGSIVLAGGPAPVWMAKMEFASLVGTDIPRFENGEQFHEWLQESGFQAIYLDFSISRDLPVIWNLIEEESGKGLREVFSDDDGSIRVYLVEPAGS